MDRVFPKTGLNPGIKPVNGPVRDKTQHIYISNGQRPHAGVHNSTSHTPGVHNQAYIK